MKKALITTLVILGTVGLVFLLALSSEKSAEKKVLSYEEMSPRDVALLCTTDMATEFHIHPTLRIFIDGKEFFLPANIGITDTCMHSLHTHSDMPVVHVEAPVAKDFTLGDFFTVWDKPFSQTILMDRTVTDAEKIEVTVNGEKVDTYENTILHDHDAIVITLGKK